MKRFLSIFVIVLVCCLLVGVLVACGGSHTCVDTTFDHRCDICDKVLTTCSDTDNNHLCDICGNSLSDCIDNDSNHVCEICGETIITCVDDNANHNCDICNKELSTCLDENADNECDICGLTFELLDNDTYEITGYNGTASNLQIPSTILGKPVTIIGEGAFEYCFSLTSVVIGDSVEHIGEEAFFACGKLIEVYNLSSLNITKGSEENGYVGYYALDIYTSLDTPSKLSTDSNGYMIYTNGEEKVLVGYTGSERELTLPNDITSIYQYAFYNCDSLTSVTIGNSVTSIGHHAFYVCHSLTSVVIPDSVTSIGDGAFFNCDSLTVINYVGTIEEWDNITKDFWYFGNCTIYYDYEIE